MDKILLTGISGNVGSAVVDYLKSINIDFLAGVRNIEKGIFSKTTTAY